MATTINRLTNIEVEEVSIVDKPANDKRFLVIKRQEKDTYDKFKKAFSGETEDIKVIFKELLEKIDETMLVEFGLQKINKGDTEMNKEFEEFKSEMTKKFEELSERIDKLSKNMGESQTEEDSKEETQKSDNTSTGFIFMERKPL